MAEILVIALEVPEGTGAALVDTVLRGLPEILPAPMPARVHLAVRGDAARVLDVFRKPSAEEGR